MVFTQLLANGLIAGAIYALVAAGFSLIYSTNKFMHFAHGVSVAFGAYLLLTLFRLLELPFFVACVLTIIVSGFFGMAMYYLIYLPMQKKKASNVILLIASIGLLILFENLIQAVYGAQVRSIGYIGVQHGISIFGASITPLQIVLIVVSLVLFGILYWYIKKTKMGRDMRAVANNKELASIVGINYQRVAGTSFFIGSCLAGVAGILIGLEQNLTPLMGTDLMVRGFTGAVIGGITSVPGAILGSFVLGIVENFGIWYLPSSYKDAIAFGLLFLFLLFKPNGLFGFDKGVKDD
jgi:branched-chain amino acid transport system permease protein